MTQPPAGAVASPPDGSPAHYGLLFCPAPRRAGLNALLALEQELVGITSPASEPSITMIRLTWWGDELRRLAAGEPRHPVTVTLFGAEPGFGDVDALLDMVSLSQRLCGAPFDNESDGIAVDCRRSSALYGATSVWLAGDAADSRESIQRAGRHLGAGLRLARLVAADPDIRASGAASEAREALREGLSAIPTSALASQIPLVVIGTLQLRRLDRPAPAVQETSRARQARDSIGMIVAAWRAARAASRGRLSFPAGGRKS